ncbi:MAG TPA: helical backbone metal receptor [Thermoanaerobaculia bacterium]|nr:helical backbone metal receptor [Thermoanaerobaculia bacterium]
MGPAGCRQAPAAARAPQRIVALAPSLTETVFALGLGPRVVGVGDFSRFPPEARTRPKLGGLFNPNLEGIVALRPDLVVLLPSERDLADKLGKLGIASIIVRNEDVNDVEHGFTLIADRCGVPETGRRLAEQFHRDLVPRAASSKPAKPQKVVLSVGRQVGRLTDLLVAGPGTFYDALLTRLGAENVFADAPVHYPQVALEEVLARAPDVILEIREDQPAPAAVRQLTTDWWGLPQLQAASRARVYVLSGDYVMVPGPRLPRLYREMGAALDTAARERK